MLVTVIMIVMVRWRISALVHVTQVNFIQIHHTIHLGQKYMDAIQSPKPPFYSRVLVQLLSVRECYDDDCKLASSSARKVALKKFQSYYLRLGSHNN